MIVVEGVDGSGKTTLVEGLQAKFPQLVPGDKFKPRFPQEFVEEEAVRTCEWYTEQIVSKSPWDHTFTLYDRFFISELVYGPVLRDRVAFVPQLLAAIIAAMDVCDALFIHCRPPEETIKANLAASHDEMDGVLEHVDELIVAYDLVFSAIRAAGLNVVTFDYTDVNALRLTMKGVDLYLDAMQLDREEQMK